MSTYFGSSIMYTQKDTCIVSYGVFHPSCRSIPRLRNGDTYSANVFELCPRVRCRRDPTFTIQRKRPEPDPHMRDHAYKKH